MQSLSLSLSHTHTQRKHGESQQFDYEVCDSECQINRLCDSERQNKQTHQGTSSTTFLLLKISAALWRLFVGIGSPAGVYVSQITFFFKHKT